MAEEYAGFLDALQGRGHADDKKIVFCYESIHELKQQWEDDKLTQSEVDNLLDVLDEWYHCDTLGVKELEENEIGLNDNRYTALIKKLNKEGK